MYGRKLNATCSQHYVVYQFDNQQVEICKKKNVQELEKI